VRHVDLLMRVGCDPHDSHWQIRILYPKTNEHISCRSRIGKRCLKDANSLAAMGIISLNLPTRSRGCIQRATAKHIQPAKRLFFFSLLCEYSRMQWCIASHTPIVAIWLSRSWPQIVRPGDTYTWTILWRKASVIKRSVHGKYRSSSDYDE
jgi:hypothetical protein